MSEPWVPVPDPDPDGYRDTNPPRCETCGSILQSVRPTKCGDEGFCSKHGTVPAIYRNAS